MKAEEKIIECPVKDHAVVIDHQTTMGFENASDSKEFTWSVQVKYRLTKRLFMFSLEPIFISSIHPDSGASATGLGDIEATLYLKMVEEKKVLPFISLAFETK